MKWLVYPSSTLRHQVRESHLQLEIWSIRLNNKPTPATRDVKCVVSGFGQDASTRSFATDSSDRSCGLRPIPKHPATLEKKSLASWVEEKNKPPPPPPPPPPNPPKKTNKQNKVTDTSYLPTVTTLDFFFFLLSFAVNFSFLKTNKKTYIKKVQPVQIFVQVKNIWFKKMPTVTIRCPFSLHELFSNQWMRLSRIWRMKQIENGVIHRGQHPPRSA